MIAYNEACLLCGRPFDIHLGGQDPPKSTPHAVWGDLNSCRTFIRCDPPRAAYSTLATWVHPPSGSSIMDDVRKMIAVLQHDRQYGPSVMYLPDEGIRHMGGDPDDYPQLEGYPNVRVVTYQGGRMEKFRDRILNAHMQGLERAIHDAKVGKDILPTAQFVAEVDAVLADADARKRCKTCKWWKGQKECYRLVDSSGLTHGSKAIAVMDGAAGLYARLMTAPDFGCTQWEEK